MSCFYNGLAGAAAFGSLIVVSFFVPGIPWINAGSIALYVLGMKLSQMFLDGRTILFSLVKLLVIPAAILSVFSRIFQDPLYKDGLGHFNVIAIAVGELEPETDTILLHVHMDTVGAEDYGNIWEYAFSCDELPEKINKYIICCSQFSILTRLLTSD